MRVIRLKVRQEGDHEVVYAKSFNAANPTNPGFVFSGIMNGARFLVRRVGANDKVKNLKSYNVWVAPVERDADGSITKVGKSVLHTLSTGINEVVKFVNAASLNPTARAIYNKQARMRKEQYVSTVKVAVPKLTPNETSRGTVEIRTSRKKSPTATVKIPVTL